VIAADPEWHAFGDVAYKLRVEQCVELRTIAARKRSV
jgi:hypothetical protein